MLFAGTFVPGNAQYIALHVGLVICTYFAFEIFFWFCMKFGVLLHYITAGPVAAARCHRPIQQIFAGFWRFIAPGGPP
jgi:uncharacterized membrane protein SirB2